MVQKELLTKKTVASVGEEIGLELGEQMIAAYAQANPTEAAGVTIGRNIISEILAQPGCAGMRFYHAINEKGQKTLVYVGIDAAGKNIIERVVVEKDGTLTTKPAIVADRGDVLGDLWKLLTGR